MILPVYGFEKHLGQRGSKEASKALRAIEVL